MSNNYYTHGSFPSTGAQATSASMRSELDLITAGFDKLPTLTSNANKFVVVNSLGTLLEVTSTLPAATVTDNTFTVQDNLDNTKTFQFQASGITTGTQRIYTMPDATTTLVGTDATQTLTNKTLTSPVISGGTINNASVGATTASTGAFTTLSASSTVSGTGFSTYLASPPAIGGTAAAAGAFTTLSASSTVSGTGFSTYLASPPAIGGTAAAAGAFTTLSASSTVSGTGFSTYLASPPAIGGTAAAAGAFTTLSASSTVSGTGFSTYLASPPAIGGTAAAAGTFTTVTANTSVTTPFVTSAAATSLLLKSAGTTAITIDTSQNVGIGTSPSGKLHVAGGANSNDLLTSSTGTTYLIMGNVDGTANAKYAYIASASQYLLFGKVNDDLATRTEYMRIDNSGNLIPASSVSQALGSTTWRWSTVYATALADGADQLVGSTSTTTKFGAGSGWTTLNLFTGGTARLSIDSGGAVGIGVNALTPSYKLDVSVSVATGGTANVARFYADASSSAEARILFGTFANAINSGISGQSDSATTGILKFYTATSGALTEKMRIDGSTPTVTVNGAASTRSMFVVGSSNSTLSGWILGNNSSGSGGIWSTSITPSGTNYTLLADGGTTTLNAGTTQIAFAIANTTKMALDSAGSLNLSGSYTEGVVAIGNSGTAQTLSLASGTVQTVTMTGNCTFTMPTATAGKSFILIVSSGAGSFTGTFTSVKWPNNAAPTLTTTATRWDILTFVSNGTSWYGNFAQAYA